MHILDCLNQEYHPNQRHVNKNTNQDNPFDSMQALINIRRSEVPVYLQESELYLSLDDENDDEICVPRNCLKRDTTIGSLTELDHFLSTVSFWIASPLRVELMNYVADRRVPGVKDVVAQYRVNFPTLFLLVLEIRLQHRGQTW